MYNGGESMAYKSLYRAYRPQTFEDVSGQQAIIKTLRHAIDENKIAHAYLFCGPRGTGKTTVAKLFAKAVNCTGEHKPCGQCANCKAIANGTHQDVIEIDAASNNGVEEVRNLIDKVKYAPIQGKYKVYIIDEVHMMSTGAFNALLKTLEEPPAHVIFILATTEPHKILPTIISRCQRFDFSRLTDEEMIDRMKTVMKEEGKTYEEGALALIAKLANGGMRDALSILEQCLAYNDEHLSEKDVNSIYGIVSLEDKINLIKVILAKDMNIALEIIEKMDQSGIDVKRLTYDLIDILKDVVIYKNTKNLSVLSVLSSSYIDSIVPYITSEDALAFIDILLAATEKFARSVNPGIYFELAILKLCNQDHAGVVTQVEKAPMPKLQPVQDLSQTRPQIAPVQKPKTQPQLQTQPQDENDYRQEDPSINDVPEDDHQPDVQSASEKKPEFHFQQTESVSKATGMIEVDEADILNILVQAKRTILNSCQEKWTVMKRYMANMNTAKAASLLVNGKPVAACPGGMVIAFEYMTDVNAANYYKNYHQIAALIKDVMGEEYKYVAIEQNAWLKLRKKFIVLHKQRKLPKPVPIVLKHIEQVNENHENKADKKLTDAQKMALDMFGPDIVEFSED